MRTENPARGATVSRARAKRKRSSAPPGPRAANQRRFRSLASAMVHLIARLRLLSALQAA